MVSGDSVTREEDEEVQISKKFKLSTTIVPEEYFQNEEKCALKPRLNTDNFGQNYQVFKLHLLVCVVVLCSGEITQRTEEFSNNNNKRMSSVKPTSSRTRGTSWLSAVAVVVVGSHRTAVETGAHWGPGMVEEPGRPGVCLARHSQCGQTDREVPGVPAVTARTNNNTELQPMERQVPVLAPTCPCRAVYRAAFSAGRGERWWTAAYQDHVMISRVDYIGIRSTNVSMNHFYNVVRAQIGTMLGLFLGEDYCEVDDRYCRHFKLYETPEEAANARRQEANTNQVAWMYDTAIQLEFALMGGVLRLWKPVGVHYFPLEDRELEGWRVQAEMEARNQAMLGGDNNNEEENSSSGGGGGGVGAARYRAPEYNQ